MDQSVAPSMVLVCGYPGCLKSTLSNAVAPRLSMAVLPTYGMGKVRRSTATGLMQDRLLRYKILVSLCRSYLSHGIDVWLDGNFPKRAWRESFLDLARQYECSEVVSIKCVCSSEDELRQRFAIRRRNRDLPDSSANDIDVYFGGKAEFEELSENEFAGISRWQIIEYDSADDSVRSVAGDTVLGGRIQALIRHYKVPRPFYTE